jgi:translocator protein
MQRRGASRNDIRWLLAFLGASFSAAGVGAILTSGAINGWYRTLRKPAWTPPDQVFAPVWSVLYLLIGLSAWLVHRQGQSSEYLAARARPALTAWVVQLGLNVAWSGVFFARRQIGGGLAVILALLPSIAVCAALSARLSRSAALMLMPYLMWTSFAALLNGRIWQLNRDRHTA